MIKRLTAMTAALILIFAVGANEKREAWGEPVKEPVAEVEEPETATKQLEPIRPKEVRNGKQNDDGSVFVPGIKQEGSASGVDVPATTWQTIGTIGGEPDTTADEGDPVAPEGEPSDVEEHSGGDEDAESDAVADVGPDEVVAEPEPEPAVEEPQMEYLGDWVATGYCPAECCCGQWAWGATASGVMPTANHTVACNSLPFGTQLMIDGIVYTVEDTGWTLYGDAWVDIFFDTHDQALAWGERIVSVYIVR